MTTQTPRSIATKLQHPQEALNRGLSMVSPRPFFNSLDGEVESLDLKNENGT